MANEIVVKSTMPQAADGGFPIAIWDKDPAYEGETVENSDGEDVDMPDGELYIADDKEHRVPVTAAVSQALAEGRLEEVRAKGRDEKPEPAPTVKK